MTKKELLPLILLFASSPGLAEPVSVTVQRLGDLRVERELYAPATVLSANRAVITSEVTALIDEIAVDVGSSVDKGATLVRLDDDNARLALRQAKASLAALDAQIVQANQRLKKAEELLTKSFVSDDELIARQTDVAVLQANREGQLVAIQIADLALARTHIRAPFNATVLQRQAQVGNFAQPGTPLLTLVQTDDREVDVELDPRYATQIPSVSNIRYVSNGKEYPVEVLRISNIIETDTRKLRARFRFVEANAAIGSSGELAWTEATGVVPVELIVQRGNVLGVFASNSGRAHFIAIPAAQEGRPATLDLADDTMIVSSGHVRLQDGDELLISDE